MWIRSQDERLLIDADKIFVSKKDDSKYEIFNIGETYNYTLGFYSSLEKALKVLDQIQYNMEPFEHEPTMVFQMPQDEDVEV